MAKKYVKPKLKAFIRRFKNEISGEKVIVKIVGIIKGKMME
jgi:hypothetical protein